MGDPRPLEGVRVLDLSRLLPGPFLTLVLADLGADVVKVEDPRLGDYLRQIPPLKGGVGGRFLAINRGKRSLALDLKDPRGKDALLRMVEQADVVVETFRPGVLDRLGVGWEALSARNPKIVLCSISGYGQTGPYRERAGHDINYVGLAGVLAMGGARGGRPVVPGVQIADHAGGLWGATAVLAALFGRETSGRGAHLDISMTEGALALLAAEMGAVDGGGEPPTRGTSVLNGAQANYDVYRTRDDRYLAVGSLEPKFYLALCQAIGRAPDLSELVAGPERQEAARAEIQAILEQKTRDEWVALFSDHDACIEPVLEVGELADHPLHRERGVFFQVDAGDLGELTQVRLPVGAPSDPSPAPRLGAHSAEVLAEYGFSSDEIAALARPAT